MRKISAIALLALLSLLTATAASASLAKLTEKDLIDTSVAIVFAEFIGTSELQIKSKNLHLSVGALRIRHLLKGSSQANVLLIRQYPRTDVVSDTYNFSVGQLGLWFLQETPGAQGLYKVSHPARFIEMKESSAALERWKAVLDDSAEY